MTLYGSEKNVSVSCCITMGLLLSCSVEDNDILFVIIEVNIELFLVGLQLFFLFSVLTF